MLLPSYVNAVIHRLEAAGHEACVVGGCVRDMLAGKAPKDYDIATSAEPQETRRALEGLRVVDYGARHGTLAVVFEGNVVEITSYRVESGYSDRRHPDSVRFTRALPEDLARRDFTVNAMAFSGRTGLVDLFGGAEDLAKKRLRCVGEAARRFEEDALRVMRALRFMSEHGFRPDEATEAAMRGGRELLREISAERIREEFTRVLCGENVLSVLMNYPDILGVFIPEILPTVGFAQHSKYHVYTVYEHIAHSVAAARGEVTVRLAMFFHDLGKPGCFTLVRGEGHFYGHAKESAAIAERVMKRLRFDSDTLREVVLLVQHHDCPIAAEESAVRRLLNRFGEETFIKLCDVHIADDLAKTPEAKRRVKTYEAAQALARELVAQEACYSLKRLAVSGHDMLAAGLSGEGVGRALDFLLEEVIAGKTANTKEELLKRLAEGFEA